MSEPKRLSRRRIHTGRIVDLSVDRVRLPDGSEVDLELIRHPGAAAVVPVDDRGTVTLVRQYRYAASGWLFELPAGTLGEDESPEECARRELEEETGLVAGRLEPLDWIFTTPGFTNERIWFFLATELSQGRQRLDPDELLTVESMPLDEAVRLAETGAIRDSKSVVGLLRARAALR